MWAPVLRRWILTRNVLPSRSSSSLDKHTAATRDNPDQRCNGRARVRVAPYARFLAALTSRLAKIWVTLSRVC
jgi:hypothetical protein